MSVGMNAGSQSANHDVVAHLLHGDILQSDSVSHLLDAITLNRRQGSVSTDNLWCDEGTNLVDKSLAKHCFIKYATTFKQNRVNLLLSCV